MNKSTKFLGIMIVSFQISLMGCGGSSSGHVDPPPTPVPTITLAADPATIVAGNSSTLTWSSTNATSCTASGAWSGSKPTSGNASVSPVASSTYSLQCSGNGGTNSKSVTVTVTQPPPVTVAIDPTSTTVEVGATKQFAATVANTTNTAVTWSTTCGGTSMGGGTVSAGGLFAAARPTGTCTVTATSDADPTKSDSAMVTVTDPANCEGGFSWLKFYSPPGGSATAKAVVILPSGDIVAAVDAISQGSSDPVATFVFYGSDGSVKNTVANSVRVRGRGKSAVSYALPSSVAAMAYDPVTDNIYAVGYVGDTTNPEGRAAMLLGLSSSGQIVLNKTYPAEFNGLRTEARAVSVRDGRTYLGVKSAYEQCGLAFGTCCGDWVFATDMQGNIVLPKFHTGSTVGLSAGIHTSMTSMLVLSDSVWVISNRMDADYNIIGYNYGNWSLLDGSLIGLRLYGFPSAYNAKIIGGLNGDDFLIGLTHWFDDPDNQRGITIDRFDSSGDWIGVFPIWYGDNSGTVSVNILHDLVLNPDASGSVTAAGSLSKIGGTDPAGPTDGGVISWAADRTVLWKKRFDNLPNNWTVSSVNGVLYDADGRLIIVGAGSDGTSCAAGSPCPLAVTGKSCYAAPAW